MSIDRITPACAGKRYTLTAQSSMVWDHPRVCGEKTNHEIKGEWDLGSPPRVRGKVGTIHRRKSNIRITPACAGKRILVAISCHRCRDHPRVCGEKYCEQVTSEHKVGSPPRVRGKD